MRINFDDLEIKAQGITRGVAHVGYVGSRRGVARWGAIVGGR